MENIEQVLIGIDVGSVSVNIAILGRSGIIYKTSYVRHYGLPIETVISSLKKVLDEYESDRIAGISATGSAGKIISELLGASFNNEVIAVAKAIGKLYPHIKTVIELGGEDSKLMILSSNQEDHKNGLYLKDFSMNAVCAAGTGSFLDKQASRLGINIEDEFGGMALKSKYPPHIAGRCTVFAKTDMIHLQQIGTPDYDIVAGLCFAVARNFKSTIARGKELIIPIAFVGGVASNKGMVRAFREVLELDDENFIVPDYYNCIGAIGTAFIEIEENKSKEFIGLEKITNYEKTSRRFESNLKKLTLEKSIKIIPQKIVPKISDTEKINAYLGIDVGSVSTNVVLIDEDNKVLASRYLPTAGRPIVAVKRGLEEIGEEIGYKAFVKGAGTTGSGRYMIGDLVGADIVRNEITAQARGAIEVGPKVDTIFEIGGQDSKYISIDNGVVVNFEMNKVCAAGTGSFLEEQAERLNINIIKEFESLAMKCECPAKFGERCTVFIESDLVTHQQAGASKEELVSGLAFSIAQNYLNRVVVKKRIGENIFFQGGTANNLAVVAAFEKILDKKITVPPYNDVIGAIGVAILSKESAKGKPSRFKGFDFSKRQYSLKSFICKKCSNNCEIKMVKIENEKPLFYGSRCERYDYDKKISLGENLPDVVDIRERILFGEFYDKSETGRIIQKEEKEKKTKDKPVVGIPRILQVFENFPFWKTFFKSIGWEVILSDRTSKEIIEESANYVTAEFCLPVKASFGHIVNLFKKDIDYIFVPSLISQPKLAEGFSNAYNCPYIQSIPYTFKSGIDFKMTNAKIIEPHLNFQKGRKFVESELIRCFKPFKVKKSTIKKALDEAERASAEFNEKLKEIGDEVLSDLGKGKYEKVIILVGRSYNTCDDGLNMNIPKKFKDLGVVALPLDCLRIENFENWREFPNMYWKYGQKILGVSEITKLYRNLYCVYVTNFGCGPDSMINHIFQYNMGEMPYLQLELDEHTADAGILTRCEAFLDSIESIKNKELKIKNLPIIETKPKFKKLYIPYMCDHAFAVVAAFRNCGIDAEVLPHPTVESADLGRRFTSGKECFPCIVTTGDIVKKIQSPDFDMKNSAFFMPTASGPCRFGQYRALQKIILKEFGYESVPILSPGSESSYRDFGNVGSSFRKKGWYGIVAVDTMEKMLREIRPYEVNKGEADRVYWDCLMKLSETIESDRDLISVMEEIKRRMKAVPTKNSVKRPIVGMVGEIYLRHNKFSNSNLIREIEDLGGEVWLAPMAEWIFYTNNRMIVEGLENKDYKNYFVGLLTDIIQTKAEHKVINVFKDELNYNYDPPVKEILKNSEPYIHHSFGGEAILSVGKAIDYYNKGASGIANVSPFTCMPGTVVTAVGKKIRRDLYNVPWIDLFYDGQQNDISFKIRLEAFMFQVKNFNNNNGLKKKGK